MTKSECVCLSQSPKTEQGLTHSIIPRFYLYRKMKKSRWTTTKGKFSRTKNRSAPSKTKLLPCEEVSEDVWTIAGVKRGCPFLGPCRTDIRSLLDPGREKKGKDSHTKKASATQNRSRDQGQEICPEEYLKLDIDVSGYLSLQIADSGFLAEVNTCKSDNTPEPSKAPLVPYQSYTGDGSNGLVPYSDDDDNDDDEGEVMYSEDVRNETPYSATVQQDKWSQRSCAEADEGFHDDFCTCKQCRERHITSEDMDSLFNVDASEKSNSRKLYVNESSTRSDADSAYWSLGSNRSTVFDTPRQSDSTAGSRTLNDAESKDTTEVQEITTRELLDMMLPPLPKEPCPLQLQVKFKKLFALKEKGLNLTELIKKNRNYQNPCLLENHIEDYSTRSSSFDQSGTHCKRLRSSQNEWPRTYTPQDEAISSPCC